LAHLGSYIPVYSLELKEHILLTDNWPRESENTLHR